ncbi:uncharacterized protein DFL_007070 [Arthrobotrys flagrans]|uniref:Uncharacterized protein n=1 Tax=Arthrobotrys flagrans TaxID=97331 RepID=A0A436ZV04_ARTFL|nr:hypothetical protein DFL_007070 [Arthrobotrys flagrans]
MSQINQMPERLQSIVSEMRSIIQNGGTAEEAKSAIGWRHGGPRFMDEVTKLKMELKDMGKKVTTVKALHAFKDIKVKNPTGRLILIPIRGTMLFKNGDPLAADCYYYLEEERVLRGEDMDLIFVVLEGKK